jgi:hypothetical protein
MLTSTKIDTSLKSVSNTANTNTTDVATLKTNSGLIVKPADQTRASSTLINDTDLFFTVAAADVTKKFLFTCHLFVDGQLYGPDVKFGFTYPAGGQCSFSGIGAHNTNLTSATPSEAAGEWQARLATDSPTPVLPFAASAVNTGIIIKGIYMPNASGAFRLQFAQNVTNATGVIVKATSFMEWRKYT